MVGIDDLAMLDLQLWLRSGEAAASRLHCAQSTISRRNNETLRCFDLRMVRDAGEWQLQGDQTLLQMERGVHQLHRMLSSSVKCRLEANFWASSVLADPLPSGWTGGCWDHVGMLRPLQLLRERVIDAWIGSYQPDLPESDHVLEVIDLCRTPVHLVASQDHPLAQRDHLTPDDLACFPSLALPSGLFPQTEAALRRHGLWTTPSRMKRYRPELWQGRTEDQVTLAYASCLALEVMPGLVPLNFDLGLISGESLLICRGLREQPKIQALLDALRSRLAEKASAYPELQLLP